MSSRTAPPSPAQTALQRAAPSRPVVAGRVILDAGTELPAIRVGEIEDILNALGSAEPTAPPLPSPPLLGRISIDAGSIGFSDRVPVCGWARADLFPNGGFSFSGHFHASGAAGYDMSFVLLVSGSEGTTFFLTKQGRVHGALEPGSQDFDWADSGSDPALAAAWAELSAGHACQWSAGANFDLNSLLDATTRAWVYHSAHVLAPTLPVE